MRDPTPPNTEPHRNRPLQFGLRALLGLMMAVSLLFGTLRWMGASTTVIAAMSVLLILALVTKEGSGGETIGRTGLLWSAYRAVCTLAVSTTAVCLYCAAINLETTLCGLFAAPLILPSILLFICFERRKWVGMGARAGFFIPVLLILGLCCYGLWHTRGSSDGADQVMDYLMEMYSIGVCVALACMQWRGPRAGLGKGGKVTAGQVRAEL